MTLEPGQITRPERSIVLAWTAILLLVVAAPIWHGYLQAKAGWQFAGFVGRYHNDYHSYLAWIRQAFEGHVLFKNLFTTEPHGRLFFHPLFWLMGTACRVSGASVQAVWAIVHVLGCVLMIMSIYRFGAQFTGCRTVRLLAFVLATTATGFGWLTSPHDQTPWLQRSIDLWVVESNQLQAMMTSFFTLPIALGLLLSTMVSALRYMRTGNRRHIWCGGILGLALAAVHQYDMVTLYSVLAIWTLMAGTKRFRGMLVLVAISMPYCLYSLAVVKYDPVMSQVSWDMRSPTVLSHVMGWGLPLLLCIASVVMPKIWRQNRDVSCLVAWLLAGVVLLCLPIAFARKLMWGMHVPICLLAAMGTVHLARAAVIPIQRRRWRQALTAAAVLIVVVCSAFGSVAFVTELFRRNAEHQWGDYLPESHLEAMRWIDEHSREGDAALATPDITPMLPGWTGITVFEGHWAQTIDQARKREFAGTLFGATGSIDINEAARILRRNRIRFIAMDRSSADRYDLTGPEFAFSSLADRVYDHDGFVIWKLKRDEKQSDEPSWTDRGWRDP